MQKNLKEMSDSDFIEYVASRIIPIKAISPDSGGEGELSRAEEICKILNELGYDDFKRYDTQDTHGVTRPNIVLKVGNQPKTFWIVPHIDTVPVGDKSLWTYDPFKATVVGDRIYGRGTSDDGQAVFLSLLLLRNLDASKLKYNLGIAFVSDEEVGSKYGIQYILEKDIFNKNDFILVPDAGTSNGLMIEIAEKSILWLKFTTKGKQYHASMPAMAINANREAMKFMLELDRSIHEKFNKVDDIFSPPYSTFEPTRHDKNVDNINTIPGTDVQFYDSRILPVYDLDMVLDFIDSKTREFNNSSSAKVSYEIMQKEQSPLPIDRNSPAVLELRKAIEKVKGSEPATYGIGGGTCAAFFRRKGYDALVWSTTLEEVAHQVDEYVLIPHILGDKQIIENIILK